MKTLTIVALAGGQGKTTSAFFIGKLLAQSHRVLMVDADPQGHLTGLLGLDVEKDEPTLLEMLRKIVTAEEAVYSLKHNNLFLIPADRALEAAQSYLAETGAANSIMRKRLQPLQDQFDYCIIDSPPARSQLSRTSIGAANLLLIPAEIDEKGVVCTYHTLDFIEEIEELDGFNGSILGILPFRDKYFGYKQSGNTVQVKDSLDEISKETNIHIFPPLRESEKVKTALKKGSLLSEVGYRDLQFCFEEVVKKL